MRGKFVLHLERSETFYKRITRYKNWYVKNL